MHFTFIFTQNGHHGFGNFSFLEELVFVDIELYQSFTHISSGFDGQTQICKFEFSDYSWHFEWYFYKCNKKYKFYESKIQYLNSKTLFILLWALNNILFVCCVFLDFSEWISILTEIPQKTQ